MERGQERYPNLVFYSVSSGGKQLNAICTLKIGHCLQEDCSIQIMTLKRHWPESAVGTRTQQKRHSSCE